MPNDLKDIILQTLVLYGTEKETQMLYETAFKSDSYEARLKILRALTYTNNKSLIEK